MRQVGVSAITSRRRVRIGNNRTLSKDEWSAVQTLNDAAVGDIPAVRSKPRRARRRLIMSWCSWI
jgi:hypothetical protein